MVEFSGRIRFSDSAFRKIFTVTLFVSIRQAEKQSSIKIQIVLPTTTISAVLGYDMVDNTYSTFQQSVFTARRRI